MLFNAINIINILMNLNISLFCVIFTGLTMYKHLPRHTFGFIQSKLFPKYFLFGAVLSSVSLATYIIENPLRSWGLQETVQVRVAKEYTCHSPSSPPLSLSLKLSLLLYIGISSCSEFLDSPSKCPVL